MSNRTKVVVAVCIIAALAGLIVLDLALSNKVTKPTESSTSTLNNPNLLVEPKTEIILTENPPASELVKEPEKLPGLPQKGTEVVQDKPKETPKPTSQLPVSGGTTYQIQQGDSLWKIARQHYGDGALYTLIEKANPALGKTLRVGTRIVIPPKPATVEKGAGQISETNGQKVYTVQPGDTLADISKKLFNTVAYTRAIFEANRALLNDEHSLAPGMRLIIPALSPKSATPDRQMTQIPAGKKTYTVQSGDSLWKIADSQKPKNINEYMDQLVKANPDKLKTKNTTLKVGWILILPD